MPSYRIKLVRDKMATYTGAVSYTTEISKEEHVALLRRKLIEEAAEYMANPSVEELADVLEVVYALTMVDLGLSLGDLNAANAIKFEARGGFFTGTIMTNETPPEIPWKKPCDRDCNCTPDSTKCTFPLT